MIRRLLMLLAGLVLLCVPACAEGLIDAGEWEAGLPSVASPEQITFSFRAPEETPMTVVTLWELRAGAWEPRMILPMRCDAGQIGLRCGESLGRGLIISLTEERRYLTAEDVGDPLVSPQGAASTRVFLTDAIPALPETEYPIALQLHPETPAEADLAMYHAPEDVPAGQAYAVTVCFTVRSEAEIYGWGAGEIVDIDAIPGDVPVGCDPAPWVDSPVWSIPEHEGPEIVE